VAAEYGIGAWYGDYEAMLAETDADAVVNLTPIQTHAETTLAALRAGTHVYSEKPVATSLADARRIRDEAARRGLTLVCAPSVLLFPQVRFARDLVASGAIGRVHAALGRGYGGVPPWSGYPSDPSPFFARGGGPLADMGVYPLHALTGILGPARRVSAFAAQAQERFVIEDGPLAGKRVPVEVADNWHLLLDFGDGRLASVTANNVARDSRAPQMEIFGLEGTISVNLLDVSAPVETLLLGEGWRSHAVPHERAAGPDHLLGVEHLVDCVTTGARPIPSIEHAIHVIEIMEAAAQSTESGRAVDLSTTFTAAG
jgi:predicted dehydrogenase